MKALITGVTGFVGSHLADYLLLIGGKDRRSSAYQEEIEVHGIRRPRSKIDFVRYDILYHEADITDYNSIARVVKQVKPDFIFHLAAQSFVPLSWTAPHATLEANILGTLNILEAVEHHLPSATILFAGSSEEYGFVKPEECPVKESQLLRPLSPYGVSKAAGDLLAQQYCRSYGLKIIITRAFNHTGPRRGEQFVESKIAHQLTLIKLSKAKPVLTLGNLEAIRDFTDVRDMVRAYWLAVNHCQPGQPYNIGTGTGHSIKELIGLLRSIASTHATIEQNPEFIRPSDVPLLICDSTAFRGTTGWQPEIPFMQTLTDLFNYWMEKESK